MTQGSVDYTQDFVAFMEEGTMLPQGACDLFTKFASYTWYMKGSGAVEFPNVHTIEIYGCWNARFTSIELPQLLRVYDYGLRGCDLLTSIDVPLLELISLQAFQNCSKLTRIDLPSVTSIGDYAFAGCTRLVTMTLPATPPTINLQGMPSQVMFYTPDEAVETYKADATWSAVADRIKPMSELTGRGCNCLIFNMLPCAERRAA